MTDGDQAPLDFRGMDLTAFACPECQSSIDWIDTDQPRGVYVIWPCRHQFDIATTTVLPKKRRGPHPVTYLNP